MQTIERQGNSSTGDVLTDDETGQKTFDFIQNTANRLAFTSEFCEALVRQFFDRNQQTDPRHYGVNVVKGPYIWHVVSFAGHDRVEKPAGNTGLDISKYDASLINADYDGSFLGSIHALVSWIEVDGVKNFSHGAALYRDQATGFPGIKDIESALPKGRLLIEDLINPVNF